MTKIMLLGDTHGNTRFITNVVMPFAIKEKVDWIYQVGDFGYWEHTTEGIYFLEDVSKALSENNIKMVTVAGNHDKVSLIRKNYFAVDGFYPIRPNLWHAENGTQWEIDGTSFVALGGAYSIDKQWRLDQENANRYYSAKETLWFPEEEMTDEEMDSILTQLKDTKIDVILAHDKPSSSNPGVKLIPIAECLPNQQRLQKAVNALQPELFVHGHLHVRYNDTIRCGDDDKYTRVMGLGADVPNFNQDENSWEPSDAWEILDL